MANPVRRKEALQFLIHFVGDLHQPLHTIEHQDRGGNDQIVEIVGYTPNRGTPNLHSAWDSILLGLRGIDEESYAADLLRDLSANPLPAESIDPVKWALEGHDVAERVVYAYPGFDRGAPPSGVARLDASYQKQAAPVIDRQLQRAGARLATILNEALAGGR
jgi:hypothetical protein